MDVLANLLGLVGVGLLAVPAFHVNKYALLIARLAKPKVNIRAEELERKRKETLAELERLRDGWTPKKARCLVVGTLIAGLSYVVPVIGDIMHAVSGCP